jgi:tetratricopeptide (TPR) repeat protein
MRRRIWRITLLSTATVCISTLLVYSQEISRKIFDAVSPSIVTVIQKDVAGKTVGFGTGFAIQNGKLVTNYHVVENGQISVQIGPVTIEAEVEKTDKLNDLAIVVLKANASLPGLSLAKATPKAGEKIYVVGNPAGLEKSISEGLVSGTRSVNGQTLIQVSAPNSPGSSGSPVLNASGEVVAIAAASLERGQNLNFAIPVDFLHGLINPTQKPATSVDIENVEKLAERLSKLGDDYDAWSKALDELRGMANDLADRAPTNDPAMALRLARVLKQTNCERATEFADRAIRGGAKFESEAVIIELGCATELFAEDATKQRAATAAQKLIPKVANLPAQFYQLYGELLNNQGKYSESEPHLRRAIALARTEKNDEVFTAALRTLLGNLDSQDDQKKRQEAIQLFNSFPGAARNGWDHYGQAGRFRKEGRFKEAASAYDAALPLIGEKNFYWIDAGITHYYADNNDTALSYLRKGIEVNAAKKNYEDVLANAHYHIALILQDRRVLDEALTHAREATVLDPKDAWHQKVAADILAELKRPSEALPFAKRAISLSDGKFATMHFTLGGIAFDLADWDQATQEFQLAANMNATDWSAAFNAGLSLERAYRNTSAVEWYLKALSRNPPAEKRYVVEQALKRVRGY